MNLLNLKTSKADIGSSMQVKNPVTDEPIAGCTISLLGQDSQKYRKLQRAKQQIALDRISKGKKATRLVAEELDEDSLTDLASMVTGWTGVSLDDSGAELECSQENIVRVFTELPWIREQAQEFMADRGNFI